VRADGGHVVCDAAELEPGGRRIVVVRGRSIGVFNVGGRFYALDNRCPHKGGPLCEGRLGGTTLPTREREFSYGLHGRILRCAWHGWEYDVTTGVALADPARRARTYPVSVEDGRVVVRV
jgi:nitrite reductase/ring-hydroxylating ferredoxin subunit